MHAQHSGDPALAADALITAGRLCLRFFAYDEALPPPERFAPTPVPPSPCLDLDLARGEIGSVIWATGYRPDYRWLHLPVFDPKGRLRHHGGVVDVPGLYAMGLPFMRRRKSSFLHGADDDARELIAHLAAYLAEASANGGMRTRVGAPHACPLSWVDDTGAAVRSSGAAPYRRWRNAPAPAG